MNSNNRKALWLFMSQENCEFLYTTLVRYWNNPQATVALQNTLPAWMMNYHDRRARELMYTEAVERDVQRTLNALNDSFLSETIKMVNTNVLYTQERADLLNDTVYNWNDGRNAKAQSIIARFPQQIVSDRDSGTRTTRLERPRAARVYADKVTGDHSKDGSMAVLESWRYPTRGREIRDDIPGDTDKDDPNVDPKMSGTTVANLVSGDGFYFTGVEPDINGVQRRQENTDYALNTMYNDPKVQLLNRNDGKYGNGKNTRAADAMPQSDVRLWSTPWSAVDESDPTQMAHLMQKRISRSQNVGRDGVVRTDDSADAQIPWYRKSIQHRNVDMQTKDSLAGNVERGYQQRGWSMDELKCRVEDNRRVNQAAGVKPFRFQCG